MTADLEQTIRRIVREEIAKAEERQMQAILRGCVEMTAQSLSRQRLKQSPRRL